MQYGIELGTYKRARNKEKEQRIERSTAPYRIIGYMLFSLLISRVMLINNSAPFGLAFLCAIVMCKDIKHSFFAGVGALIGYITLINSIEGLSIYLLLIISITASSYIMKNISRSKRFILLISIILFENILFNLLVNHYSLIVNLTQSSIQTVIILPIYFIFKYAVSCFEEINTKHLFNNEEIISMAILISIAVSGLWGLAVFDISIRNIIALTVVVMMAYVNGSSIGAAAGVAAGVIIGISSNNMNIYVSVYGVCGLIAGLFRETGKYLTCLAYMILFVILKLYSNLGNDFKIIEGIITSVLFLIIPQRIYSAISFEIDWEKKQNLMNESHLAKVKEVLTDRLKSFNDILYSMSNILNGFMDNDKLLMKGKSSGIIENLADRVCSSCDMRNICWKRELHYTYSAFSELIENFHDKSYVIPQEINKKCIKRTALTKEAENIVNNHIIDEMWRSRLVEGRKMLSSQITGMSDTLSEIVKDFNSEVVFNHDIEKLLIKTLSKAQVKYSDIFCYCDKKGRLNIKITMEACSGGQPCVKQLLPIINEAVNKTMCISGEGCLISAETKKCSVVFEETPKFHVATYAATACKTGESYIGDSYSFGRMRDGNHITIISDGMGSGAEAGKDSKAAVELIEKFEEAGFNSITAINTVNSIISMRFDEEEKFSTLDLNSIDLYSGDSVFMKVGAAASFIKRGNKLEIINSKTLPIGVLDKPDVDIIEKKLKNGDIVISISDGILDVNSKSAVSNDWICSFLKETKCANPKELVVEILDKAKELSGGKPKDDMTILVSKVYGIY